MRCLFLWVLLFCFGAAGGQSLRGRVVEDRGGEQSGLPGANVYWVEGTAGVTTDAEGYFSIGRRGVRLVASFVGYEPDTVEVGAASDNLLIVLTYGRQLDEAVVAKRRRTTVMSTAAPLIEQLITDEELYKAACCNLGESFTTNASVDVAYSDAVTGAKQIQLLGLHGKYVQMMTENMPNFRGLAALYGLNYVPGPWMSAISVSKGAGSVVHGYEAIAGQINVDYKKPEFSEKLFVNLYGSHEGMAELNLNSAVRLSNTWSTALLVHGDWFNRSHDYNGDGFLDMPKKNQYNVMNRWAYKTDAWYLQFGGKFLDEERLGGQKGYTGEMRGQGAPGDLYGIDVDTRRYEGFLKLGYLMPQYTYTSMALLLNYTDHRQDSYYGARNYDARQHTLFANYIYQSVFGTDADHAYSAGLSFTYDRYDEAFTDYMPQDRRTAAAEWRREERSGGAFFQYTGHFGEKVTLLAGLRYDHHNLAGGFFTPRLNIAYAPDGLTTLKLAVGAGSRQAAVLAENAYLLASSRPVYVNGLLLAEHPAALEQLRMERAWNFGVLLNRKWVLFDRLLNINLDYYRTDFSRQVVADNETRSGQVHFYNLTGASYSNCYQAEIRYEPLPRMDVTLAYRYNDARMTYTGASGEERTLRTPLQSKYKGLVNVSFYTNLKKWQFDFTTQFNGGGRLPGDTGSFGSYEIVNAQVTKFFRRWSVYAGCENIGDFTQKHPILSAEDPWGEHFDASQVWGPVTGRKFYAGLRFSWE
ncbi:MAG: TonB-dependent receptor [Culturomica sp.]|jgi:outer membrane receptor for ferrienterochelin and colicin|nr:TonB-dependent receptor [Culturomica sp.]